MTPASGSSTPRSTGRWRSCRAMRAPCAASRRSRRRGPTGYSHAESSNTRTGCRFPRDRDSAVVGPAALRALHCAPVGSARRDVLAGALGRGFARACGSTPLICTHRWAPEPIRAQTTLPRTPLRDAIDLPLPARAQTPRRAACCCRGGPDCADRVCAASVCPPCAGRPNRDAPSSRPGRARTGCRPGSARATRSPAPLSGLRAPASRRVRQHR